MGLYIQMHSMHGLFRSQNIELGRDEDTGGQIVYVLELAKALGKLKGVDRVDIITRRIVDPEYPGYSKKIEEVTNKVAIVRIECGGLKYIKKINLWPLLDEFIANTKKYIKSIKRKPDILQSNYADSGLVCSVISKDLKILQVHTGHSLGIPKLNRMSVTKSNLKKINNIYHFDKRVDAENAAINNSSYIITSTKEEITEQYKEYGYKKYLNKFNVVAPGIEIERFVPKKSSEFKHVDLEIDQIMGNMIKQNLKDPKKKIVTVLTRLDNRKNLTGLLEAFADDQEFRKLANIIVFAQTLSGDEEAQKVIDKINKLIKTKDLYGQVLLAGFRLEHDKQVPAYYRYIAKNKGIFVNPALIEPFGLTILEAGACGVPVVATNQGGPSDIITDGVDGLLINPKDPKDIAKQIKKLIKDKKLYDQISKNITSMVKKDYTWDASAKKYMEVFKKAIKGD